MADGLHEIRSLFCPLTLADRIVVSDADADQVVCPGVDGPNLAEEALAALRARGWRRSPARVEIEKRIPVAAGLGGGSADAAALLRLARDEVDGLAGLAAELGADVPSQLDPAFALVGGAGEAVEPLPPPGEFAAVLLPAENGLRTADVYAEADRLGLGRDLAELDAIAEKLRGVAAPSASPLDYRELLVNDLARGGAVPAARDRRGARGARGGGGAGGAGRRVGPHGLWAVRRHRRRRPGSRGAAAPPCERDRGGARDEPMSANGGRAEALAPSHC